MKQVFKMLNKLFNWKNKLINIKSFAKKKIKKCVIRVREWNQYAISKENNWDNQKFIVKK